MGLLPAVWRTYSAGCVQCVWCAEVGCCIGSTLAITVESYCWIQYAELYGWILCCELLLAPELHSHSLCTSQNTRYLQRRRPGILVEGQGARLASVLPSRHPLQESQLFLCLAVLLGLKFKNSASMQGFLFNLFLFSKIVIFLILVTQSVTIGLCYALACVGTCSMCNGVAS